MANLSADVIHATRPTAGRDSFVIDDGVTLFRGSFVGVDASGYLDKWADTLDHKFMGILLDGDMRANGTTIIGETSDTLPPEGRVDTSGVTLLSATVASAVQGSVNSEVFCSTDNPADLTLVSTNNTGAIGFVKRYVSAGVADVQLYSTGTGVSTAAAPQFYTLAFYTDLATITDADIITDYTIGHAFRLEKIAVICETAVSTSSKLSTISMDIGSTATTGGAVALTSANLATKGAVVAGSAITAANVGTAASTFTIKAASTTAFAEGSAWIVVTIQNLS